MRELAQYFGYWLRRRRKALDLTQEALAERVSCSGFAIRKIEADERRPSLPLAHRLADALAVPVEERQAFLEAARAVRSASRLPLGRSPVNSPASITDEDAPREAALYAKNETAPFVGRAKEYDVLIELVAGLAGGSGNTVLIEGEPGIGKSRLIREFVRHAESLGLFTIATNCYEIERAIPYQPVINLVTSALNRTTPSALSKLAPVSLANSPRWFPPWRSAIHSCRRCRGISQKRARLDCPTRLGSYSQQRDGAGPRFWLWMTSSGRMRQARGCFTTSLGTPPNNRR